VPKLHYAGQTFELAASGENENIVNRIDQALTAGRALVGNTGVPTNMILGLTELANGNHLLFAFSGSLPIAIETDTIEPAAQS
jgi:hypothetical protein